MSIEERIAEVVGDHWPGGGGGFCEGCDWIFEGEHQPGEPYPWPQHVAAVLVQELGLTQEFDSIPEWDQPPYSGDYPRIVSWRQGTRYVTDWETA